MSNKKLEALKKWGGLLVTSLALAIVIIDTTVLNVSLRDIMKDLGADLQTMQWTITVYSLVLAALTITGGRLGDLFGRKKMFILGAILFGAGSFIASISTTSTMLLIGWSLIEGIGASLMMPATASILITTFKGKERAIAFGVWGSVAGASAAFGPLIGGYLTANVSWHWAFRINVFVVLIVLLGSFLIKETIEKKEKHELDFFGSLLSGVSMASIIYGIVESSTYGWWKAKTIWEIAGKEISFGDISITPIAIGIGVIFLAAFVGWEKYRESQKKTPLVSLKIFSNKQFVVGLLVTAILALGQAGIVFSIPVFLQSVKGLDAFTVGKALLPMSLSILVFAPLSGFLKSKFKTRDLIQAGIFINFIGIIVLFKTLTPETEVADLIPGLALLGMGMGITSSIISNVTLSALSVELAGEASGVNNTLRQLGSSLGSALIGAVFISTITTGISNGVTSSKVIPDMMKPAIVAQAESSQTTYENEQRLEKTNDPAAIALGEEMIKIKNNATTDASKEALKLTAAVTLLGLLSTMLLQREIKDEADGKAVSVGH